MTGPGLCAAELDPAGAFRGEAVAYLLRCGWWPETARRFVDELERSGRNPLLAVWDLVTP